jgi:SAM-dependent methyltransferase
MWACLQRNRQPWENKMTTPVNILIGLVGLLLLIVLLNFAWRFASSRTSIPCPVWLSGLLEREYPFGVNRAKVIVQHLNLQPGMKVLDLGCGPGRLTIPIAEQLGPRGEVVAVDMQAGMLRRAQEKSQAAKLNNIQFLQAGAGEGKLARNQFDRVIMVTVLGEIVDQEAALREIYGSLKPGGLLSVTETVSDPHFQRRDAVLRLAKKVGFVEREFYGNRFTFTLNLEKT